MSLERMLTKHDRELPDTLRPQSKRISRVRLRNQARNYDALSQADSAPIADRAIKRSSSRIDTIHDVLSDLCIESKLVKN